jgi:sugar phosphate isomerase/epimerase
LHVHDNDGVKDWHWPPGYGNIDWSKVIRSLKKVNYKGVFMTEIDEITPDDIAKISLQKATNILNLQ